MELRRALLLFAIVLALAAVVTSLSQPSGRSRIPAAPAEPVAPPPTGRAAGPPLQPVVRFDADRAPVTKSLPTGRAATVTVASQVAGEVRIDSLGLSATVEPGVPARFDVYETRPGRHRLVLSTGGDVRGRTLGVLTFRIGG